MHCFRPPPPGFDATAHIRTVAPGLGLPVPDADISAVAENLNRTAGFAALVARVEGIDGIEPAPVFVPEMGP